MVIFIDENEHNYVELEEKFVHLLNRLKGKKNT